MKILVNTPSLSLLGGVANHCSGLLPYFKSKVIVNVVGKRNNKSGSGRYWILWDIIKFIFKLLYFRPNIVWLNPSIGKSALTRDFIFLNIAKSLGFKVAIFIHGFDLANFAKYNKGWMSTNFNKASVILVLAEDFKRRLKEIGVTVPIELTTTKVDDRLLDGFDISSRDGKSGDLLFLARVEKNKGIYETMETYKILKKDYPQLSLKIVGDGSELQNIIKYVNNEKLKDVTITGRLSGKDIVEAYKSALLLILTSYGEGMPTTVLEAMAFGLPIITRPVGGLVDFFDNGKMGYMDPTFDPEVIAELVRPFIEKPELTKTVGQYNFEFARKKFMASSVACKLETIFKRYSI